QPIGMPIEKFGERMGELGCRRFRHSSYMYSRLAAVPSRRDGRGLDGGLAGGGGWGGAAVGDPIFEGAAEPALAEFGDGEVAEHAVAFGLGFGEPLVGGGFVGKVRMFGVIALDVGGLAALDDGLEIEQVAVIAALRRARIEHAGVGP